jgi:hypothetical protein
MQRKLSYSNALLHVRKFEFSAYFEVYGFMCIIKNVYYSELISF